MNNNFDNYVLDIIGTKTKKKIKLHKKANIFASLSMTTKS